LGVTAGPALLPGHRLILHHDVQLALAAGGRRFHHRAGGLGAVLVFGLLGVLRGNGGAALGQRAAAAGGVELVGIGPDLALDVVGDLGVIGQELLGVVPALAQTDVSVVEPGTALLDDAQDRKSVG